MSELTAVWRLATTCFLDNGLPYAVLGQLLTGRDSTILIARNGPDLVGFAVVRAGRDEGRSIGVIVSLGVDAGRRRNGIGRRLLLQAHRWLQQAGVDRIRLEVAQDNAAAIALYRSHGYRVVGTLPHYYGLGRDGLRMERPIPRVGVRRQPR